MREVDSILKTVGVLDMPKVVCVVMDWFRLGNSVVHADVVLPVWESLT